MRNEEEARKTDWKYNRERLLVPKDKKMEINAIALSDNDADSYGSSEQQ